VLVNGPQDGKFSNILVFSNVIGLWNETTSGKWRTDVKNIDAVILIAHPRYLFLAYPRVGTIMGKFEGF
jgi:hypothetical protein